MYGVWIRAGATVPIAVLIAALLNFILPYVLPYLGPEDEILYQSFAALQGNAIVLGLAAIGAGVLAAAVAESNAGRI